MKPKIPIYLIKNKSKRRNKSLNVQDQNINSTIQLNQQEEV